MDLRTNTAEGQPVTFAGCAEVLPHAFRCLHRGCFLTLGELTLKKKKKRIQHITGNTGCGDGEASYLSSQFPPCPVCLCLSRDCRPCSRLLPRSALRSSWPARWLLVLLAPVSWLPFSRPQRPFSPGRESAGDPSCQSSLQSTGLVSSRAPTPEEKEIANKSPRTAHPLWVTSVVIVFLDQRNCPSVNLTVARPHLNVLEGLKFADVLAEEQQIQREVVPLAVRGGQNAHSGE